MIEVYTYTSSPTFWNPLAPYPQNLDNNHNVVLQKRKNIKYTSITPSNGRAGAQHERNPKETTGAKTKLKAAGSHNLECDLAGDARAR